MEFCCLKRITLLTAFIALVSAGNFRDDYKDSLTKLMKNIANIDDIANIVPTTNSSYDDNPVVVETNMYVRSLQIDSTFKEMDVMLTFRNQWTDSRLQFDDKGGRIGYLNLPRDANIWTPDIFFSNEIDGNFHNMLSPNTLFRVFPDGSILHSTRVSLTLSCAMELDLFPLDTQKCSIILASYGHTIRDIVLNWKDDDPVQITSSLHRLADFTLDSFLTDYCSAKTNTGEYSCLRVDFILKRNSSYVLGRIYYPTIFLVIISWMGFWLSPKQASAKVMLSASTFIVAMVYSTWQYRDLVGNISYPTSLSDWLNRCHVLLLVALVEAVLVCWMAGDKQTEPGNTRVTSKSKLQKVLNRFAWNAHPIDLIFRIFFPIIFILYNLVYWIKLSSLASDEDVANSVGKVNNVRV